MLPFGESLNLGIALKQGREMSFGWVLHSLSSFYPRSPCGQRPVSDSGVLTNGAGGWGGSVAEWGCPPDTFQSTFSAVASGLCFFCTCSGGGVRDVSFVGGTATQPPSVTWCHLVREALVICALVIGPACFMFVVLLVVPAG